MIVSLFVRLVELVVEQLGVVNSKATLLAAHPYDFIDHVELVFGDFCPLELLNDHVSHRLVLAVAHVEVAPFGASSELLRLLFSEVF